MGCCSLASHWRKYALQAARLMSWLPGTTSTRRRGRSRAAANCSRNSRTCSNSDGRAHSARSPETTTRSGRSPPASARPRRSSCSRANSESRCWSSTVRPLLPNRWLWPNCGSDRCRMVIASPGITPPSSLPSAAAPSRSSINRAALASPVGCAGTHPSLLRGDPIAMPTDHGPEQAAALNLWDDPERARRVMSRLAAVEGDIQTVARLQGQLEDLETLNQLALEEDDDSVAGELAQGLTALTAAVDDLEVLALLGGEFDDRDAIVTIHPGAGGTESQDWAEMLWRMEVRWAERRGFKVTVNDYQEGDEAGIKSVTMTVEGPRAYGLLSAEAGTHRLVRISPFDQARRRHTSFAAVDVIPVLEDEDAPEIDEGDLRIDIFRSSGPGGQGVNTTDSAVRITHLPTGIVVAVQNERSQLANKTIALKILAARLAERARKEREQQLAALRGERRGIAFGNQIRSYVLHPYQLVKDHRTGVETGNVQAVLDGDLDQFVAAELRRRAAVRSGGSEGGEQG